MTPITFAAYVATVKARFSEAGDPQVAQQQMAYMKGKFEFFGLKMPAWSVIAKQMHQDHGIPTGEDLKEMIRLCFSDDHREMHYFALECLQKKLRTLGEADIDFLEELITTNSWWDSVDWLNKLVGLHFKRFPHLIAPVTTRWMDSGNVWLQRVCIIFQLAYKHTTDAELLFSNIKKISRSKEFFLQKAAGWALRQYARVNPEAVLLFLSQTQLAPLTRREASKHLSAQ
jgi:3-methyladenine DNA glycosylase AlkD